MKRSLLIITSFTCLIPSAARADEKIYRQAIPGTVLFYNVYGDGRVSSGSGVLVDAERRIVATAHHVVNTLLREGKTRMSVVFPQLDKNKKIITDAIYYKKHLNKLQVPATVIYQNRTKDLALLQLDKLPPQAKAIPLADDSDPSPGERIHVLGNSTFFHGGAFGYSTGTVRNMYYYHRKTFFTVPFVFFALAHHAPTNRGDSGGPVVNGRGQLVGIISQGTTGSGDEQVIDHSVHVREIRRALETLGTIQLPTLTSLTMNMHVDSTGEDSFFLPVTSGHEVNMTLAGNGSTDLDLFAKDLDVVKQYKLRSGVIVKDYQRLLAEEGDSDQEKAAFTPSFNGTCLVQVRNLGRSQYNNYNMTVKWAKPVTGPLTIIRRLAPMKTDTIKLRYEAGKGKARIAVRGDGDMNLDLEVLDPKNNVVAKGNEPDDREEITFNPTMTGIYTIRVISVNPIGRQTPIWCEYVLTTD
jgi:S1-C subfamily serine protease